MRPEDLEIGALAPDRAPAAVELFARAFHENPAWVWTLPDAARRDRILRFFYRAAIEYAFGHGRLLATRGALRGAAIVLPPERPFLDGRGLSRAGLWQLPFRAGLAAFSRFRTQGRGFGERQRSDAPARHFYLWEIAVDPGAQGLGIGTALLASIVAESERAGAPIYVDTTDPRNLAFYQRQGFGVVAHGAFTSASCRYWTLLRPAAGVTSA